MKVSSFARLRILSLAFLLPGLAGLVISALISTSFLDSLPRSPDPGTQRVVPRDIHGVVVYQTAQEDRRLSAMEYSSVTVFLVGLSLGLFYLGNWGRIRAAELEKGGLSPLRPK
jgi:hypothetical protein